MKRLEYTPFYYNRLNEFIQTFSFKNSIHTISMANDQELALLVQGAEFYNKGVSSSLLVVFTAAQFDRDDKKPPFFSGAGLAKSLQLPLLAIADPTLNLNDTLPLAWYAGNRFLP